MSDPPSASTFRVIRCSANYGLMIVVAPEDSAPENQTAIYYRCANYSFDGEPTDQFHQISRRAALGYFSGQADGLGYAAVPIGKFDSLDAVLAYRTAHRCQPEPTSVTAPDAAYRVPPNATEYWDMMGGLIRSARVALGDDMAFSILLSRLTQELRRLHGAEAAAIVLQRLVETMPEVAQHDVTDAG